MLWGQEVEISRTARSYQQNYRKQKVGYPPPPPYLHSNKMQKELKLKFEKKKSFKKTPA
jgi:hypothetical protein